MDPEIWRMFWLAVTGLLVVCFIIVMAPVVADAMKWVESKIKERK